MRTDAGTAGADDRDPLGMDDIGAVRRRIGRLVPQAVARRGLAVDVETDGTTFDADEPIALTVVIRNRLPVPVSLAIEGKRLWGWSVDGNLAASDEPLYESAARRRLDLRGFETRRVRRVWNGRIKRRGSPTRWERVDPGDHEIAAFVPAAGGTVVGSTTVTLEP